MYQIEFNGKTFEFDDDAIGIQGLDGISRVPARESSAPTTGEDGGNIYNVLKDMRVIIVSGEIVTATATEYLDERDSVASAYKLGFRDLMTVSRYEGGVLIRSRAINATVVDEPDYDESVGEINECGYEFVVKCENPNFLDANETSVTLDLAPAGGFATTFASPFGTGASTLNQAVLTNAGDASTYPQVEITADVDNPTVSNLTTGGSFTITGSYTGSDTIQVFRTNKGFFYRLNGIMGDETAGTNLLPLVTGALFQLQPGNNTVKFTATNNTDSGQATVTFRSEYGQF
jgi:hypothetical protein